jgi:hypothetical protein
MHMIMSSPLPLTRQIQASAKRRPTPTLYLKLTNSPRILLTFASHGFGEVVGAWGLALVVAAGALVAAPALHHESGVSTRWRKSTLSPPGGNTQDQVTTYCEEDDADLPAALPPDGDRDSDEC